LRLKISEKIRGRYSSVLDSGEVEDGLTWQISSTFTGLVDAMTINKGEMDVEREQNKFGNRIPSLKRTINL
jgi:hypothetical protein